jgi:tripartite-type tricarboxylate transporter receptor subunit TctC
MCQRICNFLGKWSAHAVGTPEFDKPVDLHRGPSDGACLMTIRADRKFSLAPPNYLRLITAAISAFLLSFSAQADPVSDFYTGRTINIMVGFGPGGGYDLYARLLARHLGAHIAGHPNVVVQNVPGAAGLGLANSLYNVAAKDGTVFGTFNRTIPLEPLLEGAKAQFDPLKFNWLGSPSNEVSACVGWHSARAKSIDDLRTIEMLMAGTGPAADATMYPTLFSNVLGLKFKVVNGYQGAADSILAMERGEVEGFCPWGWASIQSSHPDWLRDHKINVLMQLGMRKHPAHPDVPLVLDLAKTQADRQALELMLSPTLYARPFAAPPGVPADRLQALRTAFKETTEDPAFLADADKSKLEIEYVSDKEIIAVLKQTYATPKDVVERTKAALK